MNRAVDGIHLDLVPRNDDVTSSRAKLLLVQAGANCFAGG